MKDSTEMERELHGQHSSSCFYLVEQWAGLEKFKIFQGIRKNSLYFFSDHIWTKNFLRKRFFFRMFSYSESI